MVSWAKGQLRGKMPRQQWTAGLAVAALLVPAPAWAWGERGHAIIARTAARLVAQRAAADQADLAVFQTKEGMLGHLANIPDIKWRSDAGDAPVLNAPTHYFDSEYATADMRWEGLPKTVADLEARLVAYCTKPPAGYECPAKSSDGKAPNASQVGTAPWRVKQLAEGMRQKFAAAKAAAPGSAEFTAAIDDAWLYGGLLAHFVGDLSNPDHTTKDADGYAVGQGGIHAYFETEVVSALDLRLEADVFDQALGQHPFSTLVKQMPKTPPAGWDTDPLAVALALILDSHSRLEALNALDKEAAVVKASSTEMGMKIPAQRRSAASTAPKYRTFIVERLAIGADTLAEVWRAAWEAGGKPNLASYHSFKYHLAPPFIAPDYLLPAPPAASLR